MQRHACAAAWSLCALWAPKSSPGEDRTIIMAFHILLGIMLPAHAPRPQNRRRLEALDAFTPTRPHNGGGLCGTIIKAARMDSLTRRAGVTNRLSCISRSVSTFAASVWHKSGPPAAFRP